MNSTDCCICGKPLIQETGCVLKHTEHLTDGGEGVPLEVEWLCMSNDCCKKWFYREVK